MGLSRRAQRADSRRGETDESRVSNGASVVRDVGLVYQSGPGAVGPLAEQRRVSEAGLRPAEKAGRGSGPPAPRAPRRGADEVDRGPVEVPWNAGRGTLQIRSLSLLGRHGRQRWLPKAPPAGGAKAFYLAGSQRTGPGSKVRRVIDVLLRRRCNFLVACTNRCAERTRRSE